MAIEHAEIVGPVPSTEPPPGPKPRLFTVDEYYKMAEVGILRPDERVELIEGVIVEMSPVGDKHVMAVIRLIRLFTSGLRDVADISPQSPIRLGGRSDPEPDVAVLHLLDSDRAPGDMSYPSPDEVYFVVEVADTSLAFDLGEKARTYGRRGIPELWVVDLSGDRIVIHRGPTANGYASVESVIRGQTLAALAFPEITFTVDQILG